MEIKEQDGVKVNKMKYKVAIYTAVFSLLSLVVTNAFPIIEKVLTSEERIMRREVVRQQSVNRVLDSIKDAEGKRQIRKTFMNVARIYDLMSSLSRELPSASSISVFSTHNSGGVPKSGTPLKITILYETGNTEMKTGKKYWQQKVMPEGYFNFSKEVYDKGDMYISELDDHPEVYHGKAKGDLDFNNVRSMYGRVLKVTPTAIYYLAVTFDHSAPMEKHCPNLKNISRVYGHSLERLIETKQPI